MTHLLIDTDAPRRFSLIGQGRIGSAVIAAWRAGELPGWELVSVLVRIAAHTDIPGVRVTTDRTEFFAASPDVIVEAAGPAAVALHAEAALAVADVWTVSAAALADAALYKRLENAAIRSGHRLRVLPGAMAGFDGVAMSAVDPAVTLLLDVELLPGDPPSAAFEGSVRDAASRFPHNVNVAAAAALAGPGMDATRIRVSHPGSVPTNRLALHADGRYGSVSVEVRPKVAQGIHPVAASIVAALQRELKPIWVG